jgi:hypothetical protein
VSEPQKRVNQFAFAAHYHFRKTLEPFAVRNLRAGVQPGGEEFELKDGNLGFVSLSHKCPFWGHRNDES